MPRPIDEIVNGLAGPQLAPQEASTPAYHPRPQASTNVRDRTYSRSRDPNSGSASGMWKHPVPSVE
jgi:hypothetical protein